MDKDKSKLLKCALSEFEDITIKSIAEDYAVFELFNAPYQIIIVAEDSFPVVCTVDNNVNYPHFAFRAVKVEGRNLRAICLREADTMVAYIHTEEERIRFCLSQLVKLVSLSHTQIVEEYQKEFLVYWNQACPLNSKYHSNQYDLFLDDEDTFQWLAQEDYPYNHVRLTKANRFFNDKKDAKKINHVPVLYLPIQDSRNIIPPGNDSPWGSKEILEIISSTMYNHISTDAYSAIKQTSYSHKSIFLVFKLFSFCFGCIIEFSNAGTAKLLHKFETQLQSVTPVRITRCDHTYLNQQIGNSAKDDHIVIVGAGSLGSYIAGEIVRSGYRNITIIDGDKYNYENTFRHALRFPVQSCSKSEALAWELRHIHPELNIVGIDAFIDEKIFLELNLCNASAIIFTVGSSDIQLRLNKFLCKKEVQVPVFYAWLEGDGKSSHVAVVADCRCGCFECLFTDEDGKLVNNIINSMPPEEIRYIGNGCGGTRIPYGNKTLLTATALLLKALEEFGGKNLVYSYSQDSMTVADFPKNARCHCCATCQ